MFNQEVKKLQNYNQEVQKFFIDKLLDTNFKSINDILNYYNLDLVTRLTPNDFEILLKLFPETMAILTNGCKPDYIPSWIKVNYCKKKKRKM